MVSVAFEIHDLQQDRNGTAEFDSVEDAMTWLAARPPFVRVLRLARVTLAADLEAKLHAAMRPLDETERARLHELDEIREHARRQELRRMQRDAAGGDAPDHRADPDPHADPLRPMSIHWRRGEGMQIAEDGDDREIPPHVYDAVIEWIRERDRWVHGRRQHVAAAHVVVWPGEVPGGDEADRVVPGGAFEPVPGYSDVEIA